MSNEKEIVKTEKDELLDIFKGDEDRKGSDLLAMSDYLSLFIEKTTCNVEFNANWENFQDISVLTSGGIAAALKTGWDITKSGTLIADSSHFGPDVVDGLKKGIYHVGQSKEVAGNLRPAIVDEKERLVKFFTLRRAVDPSEVLKDVSAISMQVALQKISLKLEDISRDVKNVNDLVRRVNLSNKFINARDRILSAVASSGEERDKYLHEADMYLMEGLNNLYSDIESHIEALAKIKGPFKKLGDIDAHLSAINEDMIMIPRYVGMRVYLFNYRKMNNEAERIVEEYRYHLENWVERKVEGIDYSAVELIHMYYPYDKKNMNFWLTEPQNMLKAVDSFKPLLKQGNKELFYIEAEEIEDEKKECL